MLHNYFKIMSDVSSSSFSSHIYVGCKVIGCYLYHLMLANFVNAFINLPEDVLFLCSGSESSIDLMKHVPSLQCTQLRNISIFISFWGIHTLHMQPFAFADHYQSSHI